MKSVLLFLTVFFTIASQAQTFKADAYGYVHDPKFKKLITDRGYQLVGAFQVVNEKKHFMVARVLKGNLEIYIDLSGKEYEDVNAVRRAGGLEEFHDEPRLVSDGSLYDKGMDVSAGSVDGSTPSDYFQRRQYFTQNGKKGLLYDGDTLFPAIYDKIQSIRYPDRLLYQLENNGLEGMADEKGNILVPVKYEELSRFQAPSPRLTYSAKLNGKYGILAVDGSVTIPFEYARLNWREGKSYIEISDYTNYMRVVGALDTNGRLIIPVIYSAISQPENGNFVFVKRGKKTGAIDFTGTFILDTIYTEQHYFAKDLYELSLYDRKDYATGIFDVRKQQLILPCEYEIDDYLSDYCPISTQRNGVTYYGLIDRKGKLIREANYTWLHYDEERAWLLFTENGKTGVVDSTGKTIVPFHYESLRLLRKGEQPHGTQNTAYFVFEENGKSGLINSANQVVIPAVYEEVKASPFGILCKKSLEEFVVLDYAGKPLFPPISFYVSNFRDGIVTYRQQRQKVLMDFYGNKVVKEI